MCCLLQSSRKYGLGSLWKIPTEGTTSIVLRVVNRTSAYNTTQVVRFVLIVLRHEHSCFSTLPAAHLFCSLARSALSSWSLNFKHLLKFKPLSDYIRAEFRDCISISSGCIHTWCFATRPTNIEG